jgi:hypothetical protein
MVRKLIKQVGRKIRTWLQEDDDAKPKSSEPLPQEFSYKWLNHILFPQVFAEGHRAH